VKEAQAGASGFVNHSRNGYHVLSQLCAVMRHTSGGVAGTRGSCLERGGLDLVPSDARAGATEENILALL
jgi:hypothetical protein